MGNKYDFSISDIVRGSREEYGMSQERFAEALGVSRGQVAHIESGRTLPSAEFLTRLDVFQNTAQVILGQL